MSEKQKFKELLSEIRSDLAYIQELQPQLNNQISNFQNSFVDEKWASFFVIHVKEWAYDVYLDKIFETDSKVKKFITALGLKNSENRIFHLELIKQNINRIVSNVDIMQGIIVLNNFSKLEDYHKNHGHIGIPCRLDPGEEELMHQESSKTEKIIGMMFDDWLEGLDFSLNAYINAIEEEMVDAKKHLYDTNWSSIKTVKAEDYVILKRARYVKARDELEKARHAVTDENYEEVLNHLRPAIELAIKEKFGFKRIKMWQFLRDAISYNFPLPSYETLYYYYIEGSERLHSGKLGTSLECKKALEFVAEFIDRLDLITTSQKDLDDFMSKSKAVSLLS